MKIKINKNKKNNLIKIKINRNMKKE